MVGHGSSTANFVTDIQFFWVFVLDLPIDVGVAGKIKKNKLIRYSKVAANKTAAI
jgi:hypothetical protein